MGAGASIVAHLATDAAKDIDAVSVTAVEAAPETLPFGSLAVSSDIGIPLADTERRSSTTWQTNYLPEKTILLRKFDRL